MKIAIVERQPVTVACMRYTGPAGEGIGRFWRVTVTPWLADLGLLDCPRYGVIHDNPLNAPPGNFRYDACVEPPPGLHVPGAAQATIAGGRYALMPFKGTSAAIGAAWDAFVAAAMTGGFKYLSDRPPFERYPRGAFFDPKTGAFACELHLPLGS